jgi:spore maturation protein CgeB
VNILYHFPYSNTLNANLYIYNGYKYAFLEKGHNFYTFTENDNLQEILEHKNINLFITNSHFFYRKFIDYFLLNKYRKKGLVVLMKIGFWNKVNENFINFNGSGLKDNPDFLKDLKAGLLADIFYSVVEQDDLRMKDFHKDTGKVFHTIPLAASNKLHYYQFNNKYKSDISYIGTNLKDKQHSFKDLLLPLKKQYDLNLYGQDWTLLDRSLGFMQKFGQFLGIEFLKTIRKPPLNINDERQIYSSSLININIHESSQIYYGGDCNERTFKILASGGFEITDNVACIRKYLKEGEEIVIGKNKDDWYEKIEYYYKNPSARSKIITNGRNRVLKDHTYKNRVEQIIRIYKDYIK